MNPQPPQDAADTPPRSNRALWRELLPVGSLGLVATFMPPLGGLAILATLEWVGPWLASWIWLGVAIYIAGFVLFAGLALLPTYAQAVLGGWAFGFAVGFPAAMLGFTGAALLAYWIGRRIAAERVVRLLQRSDQWRAVHHELIHSGFGRTLWIVTLLRLPPTSPFALTNVVLASAGVARGPYLLGTILGMAPRTAMAVFAAAGLSQLDLRSPEGADSRWFFFFAITATLLAVIVIGLFAQRALRRLGREARSGREV